jgi:DNA polymerase-4
MKSGVWTGRRVVAHIDMDAFYASIEALDDPSLRGLPVIVGGDARRGVVSAASYEARAFGVRSAMPMFEARRRCPNGVFLPGRMGRYAEISREVMTCLEEFSPLVEQVSIDEAYVDLTGTGNVLGEPEHAALAMKSRIRERTSLTCSVGVSTTKLLAKVASDMRKPDGLTVVAPAEIVSFLASLPIAKVPGIGAKSGEELSKLGVRFAGDLARFAPGLLAERFGKYGEWLAEVALGGADAPVEPYTAPKSVSAEDTLPEDTDDERVLARALLEQSERVGRRLREEGFRGRTVTLKIKHKDFRQVTRSVTLPEPTQLGETIYLEARKLLAVYSLRSKVRLVGVGVSNLEPDDSAEQLALFGGRERAAEKWGRIERAADEIARRFGSGALRRGSLAEKDERAGPPRRGHERNRL